MPVPLLAIAGITKTVSVTVDGLPEPILVKYRPYRMTPALEARIAEAQDTDGYLDTFAEIVDSWDILDESGVPIPVTETTKGKVHPSSILRDIPTALLIAIMRTISEDQNPPETTTRGSFAS